MTALAKLASSASGMTDVTQQLIRIGLALSSTRDLGALLDLILTEARRMTKADAGSIYLLHADKLRFETSQNQTLFGRLGEEAVRSMFRRFDLPLNGKSIAGYVAFSKDLVNIADVYHMPARYGFQHNPAWDKANAYRTTSVLGVPMLDQEGGIVGVLQLINAEDEEGRIIPFSPDSEPIISAFASQAAVAIVNATLHTELRKSYLDSIFRLGVAAEFRDKETANHIKRVSEYCVLMGRAKGLADEEIETLRWASAMHDTGKLGIPDAILHKPGPLTPEERATMECHTLVGALILKGGGNNQLIHASQVVALTHHERWDGTGYPRRLASEDIPLYGRMTALADVYDALSSRRVYKPPFSEDKVLSILREERGLHFDPQLVDILLGRMDEIIAIRERFADRDEDFEKIVNMTKLSIDDVL